MPKQHPLTKAELHSELKKIFKQFGILFSKKLDSLKLGKRLDRIDVKIDIAFEDFKDVMILVRYQQEKIKELEKRIDEVTQLNRS